MNSGYNELTDTTNIEILFTYLRIIDYNVKLNPQADVTPCIANLFSGHEGVRYREV